MATAKQCKDTLNPKLSADPIESKSYSPLFDKVVLDDTDHETINTLRQILMGKKQ